MDGDQGEDLIAVGSTGTLLSLMGKEMEILQARRSSCSVDPHHRNYRRCSSGKWYIHTSTYTSPISGYAAGSPAPSLSPPPPPLSSPSPPPPPPPHLLLPARIVSSLWSDLKSLLRSPTSVFHIPQLLYHNNFLFCKEDIPELAPLATPPSCNISATSSHYNSPPSPSLLPSPSPKKNYPKQKAALPSCSTSRSNYPKETVVAEAASYLTQKSSLNVDKHASATSTAAQNYPNGQSPLYIKERSAAEALADPYPNRKVPINNPLLGKEEDLENHPNQVSPSCTKSDHGTRKGNYCPNERSYTAGTAAAADPATIKCPAYPKQQVKEGVTAPLTTRKATSRSSSSDADTQKGKLWEETRGSGRSRKSCSRMKREESRMVCMQEYEYWVQKREERGCMQQEDACMKKREERECMQRPILQEGRPAFGAPSFKSFGGRSNLPPVSVVDLQCCHTTPLERSSRRLSFTRLSSFS